MHYSMYRLNVSFTGLFKASFNVSIQCIFLIYHSSMHHTCIDPIASFTALFNAPFNACIALAVDFIFVEAANLQIELARLAVPHSHTQSPS